MGGGVGIGLILNLKQFQPPLNLCLSKAGVCDEKLADLPVHLLFLEALLL